jgi:hypothetical protein
LLLTRRIVRREWIACGTDSARSRRGCGLFVFEEPTAMTDTVKIKGGKRTSTTTHAEGAAADPAAVIDAETWDSAADAPPIRPVNTEPENSDPVSDGLVDPRDKLEKDADHLGLNAKDAAKYRADYNKLVVKFTTLLGGNLSGYVAAGTECLNAMVWQKNHLDESVRRTNPNVSKTAWTDGDFDRFCNNFGDDVRRATGLKSEAIVSRVSDCVRVAVFVRETRKLVGDVVDELPFSLYQKFLTPASLSFSKIDLDGEIKTPWAVFVKEWVPKLAMFGRKGTEFENETDRRAALEAAIAAHKQRLEDDRNATKSVEQVALEATKKDLRDKQRVHDKAASSLNTALSEALGGKLSPQEVMGMISSVAEAMNVDLGSSAMTAMKIESGKDVRLICQALFAQGRYDLLGSLAETASKLMDAARAAGMVA